MIKFLPFEKRVVSFCSSVSRRPYRFQFRQSSSSGKLLASETKAKWWSWVLKLKSDQETQYATVGLGIFCVTVSLVSIHYSITYYNYNFIIFKETVGQSN